MAIMTIRPMTINEAIQTINEWWEAGRLPLSMAVKVWLAVNDMRQRELAARLDMSPSALAQAVRNPRHPRRDEIWSQISQ